MAKTTKASSRDAAFQSNNHCSTTASRRMDSWSQHWRMACLGTMDYTLSLWFDQLSLGWRLLSISESNLGQEWCPSSRVQSDEMYAGIDG